MLRLAKCVWAVGLVFAATAAYCQQSAFKAQIVLNRGGHSLKDASQAVVWLIPVGGPTLRPPAQQEIPKLIQKNKAFHPALVVVPVGGKVEFPNEDPFFHNVFSLFEGKRFDLGLYESGSTRFVQFDKPGVSYIFCNIHAEMSAVVVALNSPYYAISNKRGEVAITDVPPGRYEMQVFHPSVVPESLRTLAREVNVGTGETSVGTLTLTESDLELAHKNKYGRDYDRPEPDSPAYARP